MPDGTADFVVNPSELPGLTEREAREFLDSNILTSRTELLLMNAFSRLADTSSPSGIYKLNESMDGGKTQSMILASVLAGFSQLTYSHYCEHHADLFELSAHSLLLEPN